MSKRTTRQSLRPARKRVGRVSFYRHHGAWWIYYREGARPIRRRAASNEADAERIASQINAQLAAAAPTLLAFHPISVGELRANFLDHHEDVLRSSVNTIRRYRAATQHLLDFASLSDHGVAAHEISSSRFVQFLRCRKVTPNGHPNTARRKLRDKGLRYVLEVCRSMYGYAQRMRHLPPYASNPFSDLQLERMRVEDAKPIFVFTAETEYQFLEAADDWEFPIHFTLAKTGMRPGELTHLLIEDLDLDEGWLHIRNKAELGWRIKTGCERAIPMFPELCLLLRRVISGRSAGPVFLRRQKAGGTQASALPDRAVMAKMLHERLEESSKLLSHDITREERLKISRGVWRDCGALKPDRIRQSFTRIAAAVGLGTATCPKSWRHTFATLLQDANVDPLIRQVSLGHKPIGANGALGMTSVYTHTRNTTHFREIQRAVNLWPRSLQLALSNPV